MCCKGSKRGEPCCRQGNGCDSKCKNQVEYSGLQTLRPSQHLCLLNKLQTLWIGPRCSPQSLLAVGSPLQISTVKPRSDQVGSCDPVEGRMILCA